MNQVLYILLGWVLGLFSPLIVEYFRSHVRKREFVRALKVELEELQHRLAVSSLSLLQSYGELDKAFASWALQLFDRRSGYDATEHIRKFLRQFLDADDALKSQLNEVGRAREGMGSTLRGFETKFLESKLAEVAKLPISAQRKIHELRNQVSILNRDVAKSDSYLMMTFNSSLSERNHDKVTSELKALYINVQRRCKTTAEKIESILSDL
jgi:hypothetical protein